MFVFLIILAFALMACGEAVPLYREKKYRELAVMGAVWSLGLALSLALVMDRPLPNPIAWMEHLLVPVFRLLEAFLGPM
ncbi:MAG TPA: hypothetical protein DEA73_06030 [Peptococcaceae bacterium]|nr:MAG: hypothetical protein XD51_0833 [Moorella sp. 60_41]HBT47420.1 hypothetical protein [Peptococcaceae bacterium]